MPRDEDVGELQDVYVRGGGGNECGELCYANSFW